MDIFILVLVIMAMIIGLTGTFLPIIPGIPLIFIAACSYGWYEGFNIITTNYLIILAVITVISLVLEHLATIFGAKYFGSSRYGIWGAVMGAIIGIFIIPPIGIFIGPIIGAFLGEYISLKNVNQALRSSTGAIIGLFGGIIIKVVIAIGIIVSFILKLL